MKVKEEREKVGLNLNIQKTKIMASVPITSWQIDGETMETVINFLFYFFFLTFINMFYLFAYTIRSETTDCHFPKIGKGVHQGCILSPYLFNLYAEYIMRNAGLEEVQAGIKIAGRNINNLRYADDTILMAES